MTPVSLTALNPQQQAVVQHTEGPVLVLAGAGSGKTRCITYRVAHLLANKRVAPEAILLLTFTNKAAAEMKERVNRLTGLSLPLAGTFHSLCAKLLRRHGPIIGIDHDFLIYDEDDQLKVVSDTLKAMGLSPKEFRPRSVLSTISQAKNELISASDYPQYARGVWQKTVSELYRAYAARLKKAGALDFDDLLLETVRLLQKSEGTRTLYQKRWRYVLIDEYQDTNQAQFVLTKLFVGKHSNLCCVGDFSQSIYRWRGADFRNLERLKTEFPDLKIFFLEQNYRSTQTILDAAHGVITHNTSHPVLSLWTQKRGGDKVTIFEALDEKEEAAFVTQVVQTALERGGRYQDVAILYRTNAQSRVLEETFIQAGIPYLLVGGTRFYQRKEIKDVLSFLRLLARSSDLVSRDRLVKVGKRRLEAFLEWIAVKGKKTLMGKRTVWLLDTILKVTGYLELFDPKDEIDASRLENIKELRSVAAEFPNLLLFLENVALVEQEQLPDQPKGNRKPDAVTLMTIHAAKGLEFPIILIIGMEEGLFPHARSFLDKENLEEERRLCYVGFTRAKVKLYLTYTQNRLYFGSRSHNLVSRFVTEIPKDLIEYIGGAPIDFSFA